MAILRRAGAFLAACALAACAQPAVIGVGGPKDGPAAPLRKAPYAVLVTGRGVIEVRLFPEDAPKAVAAFSELASGRREWTDPGTGQKTSRPLFNGTVFFRVIPGFIIQGGDPLGTGSGGPGFTFEDEIRPSRNFDRAGMVAMASPGPNANGSQFFITVTPAPWLNGKHTVFGEVVKGLEVAEAIASSDREIYDSSGRQIDRPKTPQDLKEVRIEER